MILLYTAQRTALSALSAHFGCTFASCLVCHETLPHLGLFEQDVKG